MLATSPLATRPLAAGPRPTRPYRIAAVTGEYGWSAWSFSRQAKLNAWAWHGLGGDNVLAWAVLGTYTYVRKDGTGLISMMLPDTFYSEGDTSTDSPTCEATTQWIDMAKPTRMKALTGFDFDAVGIVEVEVYVSVGGDRNGTLAATIPVAAADGGWTYAGEVVPCEVASTAFKFRFIGNGLTECQLNKLTLHFDEIEG